MRIHNAIVLTLLIAAAPALSGCADFDMDKLDVLGLNKKKPLPGERHDVFPEGVPGVARGIPAELMKGQAQSQPGAAVPLDSVAQQPAEGEQKTAAAAPDEEKPKVKPKPKPKQVVSRPTRIEMKPQEQQPDAASAQTAPAQPAPAQTAQPTQSAQAPGGWPPPENNASSPWPAPVPAGTFSKQ